MLNDTLHSEYTKWRSSTMKNLVSCRGAAGRLVMKGLTEYVGSEDLYLMLDARVFRRRIVEVSEAKWAMKLSRRLEDYEDRALVLLLASGCPVDVLSEAVLQGKLCAAEATEYAGN